MNAPKSLLIIEIMSKKHCRLICFLLHHFSLFFYYFQLIYVFLLHANYFHNRFTYKYKEQGKNNKWKTSFFLGNRISPLDFCNKSYKSLIIICRIFEKKHKQKKKQRRTKYEMKHVYTDNLNQTKSKTGHT